MTETKASETKTGGVLSKLKAHRSAHEKTADMTLPETGVVVTYPLFLSHGELMKSAKAAKGDTMAMQIYFIVRTCLFDGEKITATDFSELMPLGDSAALINRLFGSGESSDGEEGNG